MEKQSFKPSAEMTFATAQADRQRLVKFCRQDKTAVLHFDLSEVMHCDSAGLALLIEAKRLCREHNRTCKIEGMSNAVHALAKFCGVDEILELC